MATTKVKTTKKNKLRPVISSEAREKQLVSLAYDRAEEKLRDGTASNQLICHFLKLGSEKETLEREKLVEENKLLRAKTEAYEAEKVTAQKYEEAIAAMKRYSPTESVIDDDVEYIDDEYY